MIAFFMICGYLCLLVTVGLLGVVGRKRDSAVDYFLASRGCGSFLLVMTIFGTTMTSFALVGSTGQAFKRGIGVYGEMASWSGLIHSACFFLIGTKLWYYGKRFGYIRRFNSSATVSRVPPWGSSCSRFSSAWWFPTW